MSNQQFCSRFAPSPTGFMHIGNLRTALYSYLITKSLNGKFIVRIEDTDQVRLVEGATEVILKTLEMTGIDYDEGPVKGGPNGPYVQSERKDIYMKYAKQLIDMGLAYYCFCSAERLAGLHDENGLGGYDRHCRNLPAEEVEANLAAGMPYVIRQKMPLEGSTSYVDEVFGEITLANEEMQDQILIKADGFPTYNFCHVIDDHLMGVTHVVRGNEYLTSTPKYCLLYDAFGWERPHYVHLPLLMGRDEDGKVSKLSKRHGAVSFQDLVNQGFLPEAIVNYIALLGWCPKDTNKEFFTMDELKQSFSIDAISKSPSVFDYEKLKWFNSAYIKEMSEEDFNAKALPVLDEFCPGEYDKIKLASLLHSRINTFAEIPENIGFVTEMPALDPEMFRNKRNKTNPELCVEILNECIPLLDAVETWNEETLSALFADHAEKTGRKLGTVMWAIRIAIARAKVTPGGGSELMEVFGKDESLRRIRLATEGK